MVGDDKLRVLTQILDLHRLRQPRQRTAGAAAGTIDMKRMRTRCTSASAKRQPMPRSACPLTTTSGSAQRADIHAQHNGRASSDFSTRQRWRRQCHIDRQRHFGLKPITMPSTRERMRCSMPVMGHASSSMALLNLSQLRLARALALEQLQP
ncbi:hypothetical protein [Mesorhizobium sp. M0408]|uniref:hypothetical protein n=1 Tax=Mesorhizobium sp. M0408 TaxID=2956942 RepID=UPI003337A44D